MTGALSSGHFGPSSVPATPCTTPPPNAVHRAKVETRAQASRQRKVIIIIGCVSISAVWHWGYFPLCTVFCTVLPHILDITRGKFNNSLYKMAAH